MIRTSQKIKWGFIVALIVSVLVIACDLPNLDIPDQTIDEGQAFEVVVLDNYAALDIADPENLTWSFYGNQNLIVTIDENRVVTIETPHENWNGSETIWFVATHPDGTSGIDSAVFTVEPVNDPPVIASALADIQLLEDSPDTIIGLSGVFHDVDTDTNGDTLAFSIAGNSNPTLVETTVGGSQLTVKPMPDQSGTSSITVRAVDHAGAYVEDSFIVTVTPVNDAPEATADRFDLYEDTPLSIDAPGVLLNDTDVENDPLTVAVVNDPVNGSLSLEPDGGFVYTPNPDFIGIDRFTYTVHDGTTTGSAAEVTLVVGPVNDPPLGVDDRYRMDEDHALSVNAPGVLGNDVDVDNAPSDLAVTLVVGPTHGTLSLNTDDGSFTYTPDGDFNGEDGFTYQPNDGALNGNVTAVTIEILAVNDPPFIKEAIGDVSVNEDAPDSLVDISGVFDDADIETDDDSLTYQLTDNTNPTLVLATLSDQTITLAYRSNQFGQADIEITATDQGGDSVAHSFTVLVTSVNDAPVALDDVYHVDEDKTLNVNKNLGVLANDTDVENDALTAVLVSGPSSGSLVLNAGGSFSYTPDSDTTGFDGFQYKAQDGSLDSNTARVTLVIGAFNDPPTVLTPILDVSVDEDATDTVIDLSETFGDADIETDEDSLTLSVLDGYDPSLVSVSLAGTTLVLSYLPDRHGQTDITVRATDRAGANADDTFHVLVTSVNDAPVAMPDAVETLEDTPKTIDVLANDTDPEDDPLQVNDVSQPSRGTVTINADHSLTYTPFDNAFGADTFTYAVSDGIDSSEAAVVTVTILPVNDAPVAGDDAIVTSEDTPHTIAVLANDTDIDGGDLRVQSVTQPGHGTVVINEDHSLTYSPKANYFGADSFLYAANDGSTNSNVATVSVSITAVNDVPVVVNAIEDVSVTEDAANTRIELSGIFDDVDIVPAGDSLTLAIEDTYDSSLVSATLEGSTLVLDYQPNQNGETSMTVRATDTAGESVTDTFAVTVLPDNDPPYVAGAIADVNVDEDAPDTIIDLADVFDDVDIETDADTLTFQVVSHSNSVLVSAAISGSQLTLDYLPNQSGTADITVSASDGQGESISNTFTVTVAAINDAPVAGNDGFETNEDTLLTVPAPGLLGNDSDVDNTQDDLRPMLVDGPSHGTLSLGADDGSFTYEPNPNFFGADYFRYRPDDGALSGNIAYVAIVVHPVNDRPEAHNQSLDTDEDTALNISLTASDVDSAVLTYTIVDSPEHGTLSGTAPNLVYSPDLNYSGPDDRFTFKASDGEFDSDVATITLTIHPVNDPPVAVNDRYRVDEDTVLEVPNAQDQGLLANDTDVEGVTLKAVKVSEPLHGTLVLNTDGSFNYTPYADYNGYDAFNYKAQDDLYDSNVATVNISVGLFNDPPTLENPIGDVNVAEDASDTVMDLSATFADVDIATNGDVLTLTVVDGHDTSLVRASISGTTLRLAYLLNQHGQTSITIKATDRAGESVADTFPVTVASVNDAPVAGADSYSVDEDNGLTIAAPGVLSNDSDVDNSQADLSALWVSGPSSGTLSLNADDGSFNYTPNPDFNGPDSFTYKPHDGDVDGNAVTVAVLVQSINDPPTRVQEIEDVPVDEDAASTLIDLSNIFHDVDMATNADVLAYEVTANSNSALLTTAIKGSVLTLDYLLNQFGTANITVTATDKAGESASDSFSVTVDPVNDAPVAGTDSYSVDEDNALTIAAPGVLSNDSDVDNTQDDLSALLVNGPSKGVLSLNADDGSFTYTPNPDANGADSFSYKPHDGALDGGAAWVTIAVRSINDPPVRIQEIADVHVAEDAASTLIDLSKIFHDVDIATNADGLAFKVVDHSNPSLIFPSISGSFLTLDYLLNQFGTANMTVTATDKTGESVSDTFTATVDPVNDKPVIASQIRLIYTPEMTPVEISLSDMAIQDPDNDTFTLTIDSSSGYSIDGPIITPDSGIRGKLLVNVHVNDGELDSETFALTVQVGDAGPPCSSAVSPSGVKGTGDIIVTYVAHDGFADETCGPSTTGSGVQQVSLYVKGPGGSDFVHVATDSGTMDGRFEYTLSQEGMYHFRTLARDKEGNQESKPSDSYDTTTLYAHTFAGYAVVAMGDATGLETSSFSLTANNVYQHLVTRKFGLLADRQDPLDHVKYFAPTGPDHEGEDDILQTGTDFKEALHHAITQWALTRLEEMPGPLYIVLTGDSAAADEFGLTPSETVTADELNEWLDTLDDALTTKSIEHPPMVVILGFDHAGSFIDNLSHEGSDPDRIIITSTDISEAAYSGPLAAGGIRSGDFFIEALFSQWARDDQNENMDLRSAFEISVRQTEEYTDSGDRYAVFPHFDTARQHPLLDDNADGKGSNDLNPAGASGMGPFKKMAYFDTGDGPVSVATGDFNQDGLIDLAVANRSANTLSILLRDETCIQDACIYDHAVGYATGVTPVSVVAGHFNTDEILDLAVANAGSDNVSILLGNGDGTFRAAVLYTAGDAPSDISAGDIDADGRTDLVVSNQASNDISVLMGNGDGTFRAAVAHDAGPGPSAVVIGTFNHEDAHLDVAVTSKGSQTVSIFLGNGDGTFMDSDGDGVLDANDECPGDSFKATPGTCGCGVADTDSDGDGTPDCLDACSYDAAKTEAGACGCGVADTDTDSDGTPDCSDACPDDSYKTGPGICGCGTPDTDSDLDGAPDCSDTCPNDADKIEPGQCGCGVADTDSDGDATPDCVDTCPDDVGKSNPGICGCGTPDTDSNSDGTADCNDACSDQTDSDLDGTNDCEDLCPADGSKTDPGQCGCGVADTDTDNDGTPDCVDACPDDGNKTSTGTCGCGVADTDSDADGTPDCSDACPDDSTKTGPGICGCGVADTDTDNDGALDCSDTCDDTQDTDLDGTSDCQDLCDTDDQKTVPGICGCNIADTDSDNDGVLDCLDECPTDPNKVFPGIKGCGAPDPEYTSYLAGESPGAMAAADFDKDGTTDLVVANQASGHVAVLLGNADGSFGTPVPFEAAGTPSAVATGDFNNDGHSDVAITHHESILVSVLLGNGDATFQTAMNYGSGDNPSAVTSADIDQDGFSDLIVANQGSDNITLILTRTDTGSDENTSPDGALAKERFLGHRTDLPGPLTIQTSGTSPDAQTPLAPGAEDTTATLWLSVNDPTRVQAAWVEIRPPGMRLAADAAVIPEDQRRVEVVWNDVDRYEGIDSGFENAGRYRVHFFVQDMDGRISLVAPPDSYSAAASGFTNYYTDALDYDVDSLHARYVYKDAAGNQAPEFHSFVNVKNGENIDTGRGYMLAWSAATDPEKHPLTYLVVVKNQAGAVLFRQDGISGTHFLLPASLFQNRSDQEIILEIYARDNYGLQSVLSDKMTVTATIGTGTALDGLLRGHVYNAHKLDWAIEKGQVIIADQTFDLYEGGFFSIPLPVGTYRVDVAVEGYDFDINYGIKILEGGITTYHIDLTPLDSDGDGVPDIQDPCPEDDNEWLNTDGDELCNNADPDDDNDGMLDEWEETYELDPLDPDDATEDKDGDGFTNRDEHELHTDPTDDSDPGSGDLPDKDGDGVPDHLDEFDDDPDEWLDTDHDGTGNNADDDDDGDDMPDEWEKENGLNPLDPDDADEDPDNDGTTNLEEYENGTNPKNAVPLRPEIVSPANGATDLSLTPQFITLDFQDPNHMDEHSASQWQVSRNPNALDGDVPTEMVYDVTSVQNLTSLTLPESLLNHGGTYYWRVRFFDSKNEASAWSEIRWFTVTQASQDDDNGNGIPDDQEIDDNELDMDNNGVPDMDQENMRCVRPASRDLTMCIKVSENVIAIDSLQWIDPNTIADPDNRPFKLPLGLINFKLTVDPGAETAVTVFLSQAMPDDTEWFKYDAMDGWNSFRDHASVSPARTSVSLNLMDGGFGDGDGTANGFILDPSGPGSNPASIYADYGGLGDDSPFGCFIQIIKY